MPGRKTFFPPEPGLILGWQAERPVDWAGRFGRRAPVEVEIGPGTGEYLAGEAARRPDWDFVGIELKYDRLVRTLRKAREGGLDNVRGVLADARVALHRLFRPGSIARLTALFPDPWPKDRHHGRRLFNRGFLALAATRLAPGGELWVVTDHGPYADWIAVEAEAAGLAPRRSRVTPGLDTRFERQWVAGGQQRFHELRFAGPWPDRTVPVPEEVPVIHVDLDGFDPEGFAPRSVRGPVTVAFKEFLYDPQKRRGMVRAVVVEPHLEQQVWIEIVRDRKGWRAGPAEGCAYVPTPGVRAALDAVRAAATRPGR